MKLVLIIAMSLLMFSCTNPKQSRYPAQAGSQAEDYGKVKVPRQVKKNHYGSNFFDDYEQADEGKNVAKIIGKLAISQAREAAPPIGSESFKSFIGRTIKDEAKAFLGPLKYKKMEGKVDDGRNELYKTLKLLDWMRGNPLELFRQLRESPDFEGKSTDEFNHHFVTGPLPGVKKYYEDGELLPSGERMLTTKENPRTVFIVHNDDVREALNTAKMGEGSANPEDKVFSVAFYNPKMDMAVGSEFMLAKEFGFTRQEKMEMRKIMRREDMDYIRSQATRLAKRAIRQSNVEGRIEIVNAVARRVPVEMTRLYFGYKADTRSIMRWSRAMQRSFFHNPTNKPSHERRAKKAGEEMREHLRGMLVKHLKTGNHIGENTIFHRLVNHPIPESLSRHISSLEYDTTTDKRNRACVGANNIYNVSTEKCIWYERIVANVMGTLVGGIETTQAAIVNTVDFFLDNPNLMPLAVTAAQSHESNPDRMAAFVWEALRFRPINPIVMRYVQKDYTFTKSGRQVKKGDVAMISNLSAMHDDSGDNPAIYKPDNFIVGRGSVNANNRHTRQRPGAANGARGNETRDDAYYFHLGNGSHKCLGDYVAQALVPAVVAEILKMPNLDRLDHNSLAETKYPNAKMQHGFIDFHDNIGALENDEDQDVSTGFPESLVLQTDKLSQNDLAINQREIHGATIADPRFIFEDFLMDYDKNDFRTCLSDVDRIDEAAEVLKEELKNDPEGAVASLAAKDKVWVDGFYNRTTSSAATDLFYCRLPRTFRACIQKGPKGVRKKLFHIKENYLTRYEACKGKLTPREQYFYKTEILSILPKTWYDKYVRPQWYARNGVNKYGRTPLAISNVPRVHNSMFKKLGRSPSLHKHEPWEKEIKFYDRANYRQTYMNPFTLIAYPKSDVTGGNNLNFYTRVDLDFRKCNSKTATKMVKKEVKSAKVKFKIPFLGFGVGKKEISNGEEDIAKGQGRFKAYEACIKEKYAMPDYIYNHYKRTYMGL